MKHSLLFLLFYCFAANAQLPKNPGHFSGVVTDGITHKPLPVKILVLDITTRDTVAATRCDSLGRYSLTIDSTKAYTIYLNMMNSHAHIPYPFTKPQNYNLGFYLHPRSYNEVFGNVAIKYDKNPLPDSTVNYLKADADYILDNPTIKTVEIVKVYDKPANRKIVEAQTKKVVKVFTDKGILPARIKVTETTGSTYLDGYFHIDIIARDK